MPNYLIQIPISLNTDFIDDYFNKITIKDLIDNEIKKNKGKIITKYDTSMILSFNRSKDAEKFNKILHYWLAPRMFLDTKQREFRYQDVNSLTQ